MPLKMQRDFIKRFILSSFRNFLSTNSTNSTTDTNLKESFIIKDGRLVMDWNSKDGQNSSFGKGKKKIPYTSEQEKFKGAIIKSVYKLKKKEGIEVLKSLKQKSKVSMDYSEYKKFIKRTAIYLCSSKINLLSKADFIVTPETSSSLNEDILREISKIYPSITILQNSFIKNNVSDIIVDYADFDVSDLTKRSIANILKKAKRDGFIEVKKVPKPFLNYISNVLKIDKHISIDQFQNANVVVFDDLYSSGFTLKEMILSMKTFSPKLVSGLTIFKS